MIDRLQALVRPIVTLALTAGILWGFAVQTISGEVFAPLATGVIMYWFGQRQAEKAKENQ